MTAPFSYPGIDHCYDCRAEIDVLSKYFELNARLDRIKQLGLYPPPSAYDFCDWIDHDVPRDHPSRLAHRVLQPSLAPDASFAELMTAVESIAARPTAVLDDDESASVARPVSTARPDDGSAGDFAASASADSAASASSDNSMQTESSRRSPIPLDSAVTLSSPSSPSSSTATRPGPRPIRDWRHLWAACTEVAALSAAELVPDMNERVGAFTACISAEVSHGRRCLSQPQPPPDHRKSMSSLY